MSWTPPDSSPPVLVDNRRSERQPPGPYKLSVLVRPSEHVSSIMAYVANESLEGLALQVRDSAGFDLGRRIQIAIAAQWHEAEIKCIRPRGTGFYIGLEWTAKGEFAKSLAGIAV